MNNNKSGDRYAHMKLIYGEELFSFMRNSRVLVVGAGGIGCELLKNLVLTGFENIDIIDLDTIDVSNLNRQFLFRQEHIGKPKSLMAKEAVLRFNPNAKINAHHGNIKDTAFGPQWFKNFNIVMNALDNVDARRHVNRMCLAANVVMLDGGTAGYLGQVKSYQKSFSECYECYQKPTQKTYAVCTIRSNPSTPVHCIVWAKLLFERLFGKVDDSNAIADFENIKREKTEDFAHLVFEKVFVKDIKELTEIKSKEVWNAGQPPEPLDEAFIKKHTSNISNDRNGSSEESTTLKDQRVWSLAENIDIFLKTTRELKENREQSGKELTFDKDDDLALDFVVASANLRAFNFHIANKSRFDVKAIAGNIVPAIATTNAVIAGFLVTEGIKVFKSMFENRNKKEPVSYVSECKEIELRRTTAKKNRKDCYVLSVPLRGPNPNCYVCSSAFISLECNCHNTTLGYFVSEILQKRLALQEPLINAGNDIIFECGEGLEQDEIEMYQSKLSKTLDQIKITNQTVLTVEDFLQDINWKITIHDRRDLEVEDFKIIGKTEAAVKVPSKEEILGKPIQDGEDNEDVLDDLIMLDTHGKEPEKPAPAFRKRKRSSEAAEASTKRQKTAFNTSANQEDIISLD